MARGCILMANYKAVDVDQLESDLTIVADAIREKGGTSEPLAFPNGMKEAVEAIQSGEESEADLLLTFISGICFKNATFPKDYELDLVIPNYSGETLFTGSTGLKKIKLSASSEALNISIGNMFSSGNNNVYNDDLTTVDLSDFKVLPNYCTGTFLNNRSLTEIIGELNTSNCTASSSLTNMFRSCASLVEVRFAKMTIKVNLNIAHPPNLSAESRQSIVDGLADLTGGTAQTVTFHADVKAKLTDEQKTQITSKNWILA